MRRFLFVVASAFTLAGAGAIPAGPVPLRVLIADGMNNHDWAPTTAWIRQVLIASGRFYVGVSSTPPRGAAATAWARWRPDFSGYDGVVGNFNRGHGRDGVHWPAEVEQAFGRYVRDGGSFVRFHAAENSFPRWQAYHEMVGLPCAVTLPVPDGLVPAAVLSPAGASRE